MTQRWFQKATVQTAIVSAIAVVVIALIYVFLGRGGGSVKVDVQDSPKANVQTAINSPNSTLVGGNLITNIIRQIPLPLKFETSIGNLRTFNRKLFDVLYVLPTDKVAFIPVIEEGEKYILFYTNEDLSEVHVPEKYRAESDITNDACWIVTLVKIDTGYDTHLERGPKSYRVPPNLSYE